MSLLARVSALLERRGTEHALIGAAALAAHGVPRATADLDILVVETAGMGGSDSGAPWARIRAQRGGRV